MIVNLTRNSTIAQNVKVANDPWQRAKGLLGEKILPQGQALVITGCQSIHMVFMQFSIDAIFCNGKHVVVGLCKDIKPFCFSPIFFKASYVIELPPGTIDLSQTKLGDQVQIA